MLCLHKYEIVRIGPAKDMLELKWKCHEDSKVKSIRPYNDSESSVSCPWMDFLPGKFHVCKKLVPTCNSHATFSGSKSHLKLFS